MQYIMSLVLIGRWVKKGSLTFVFPQRKGRSKSAKIVSTRSQQHQLLSRILASWESCSDLNKAHCVFGTHDGISDIKER